MFVFYISDVMLIDTHDSGEIYMVIFVQRLESWVFPIQKSKTKQRITFINYFFNCFLILFLHVIPCVAFWLACLFFKAISSWGVQNKIDFLSLSSTRHAEDVREVCLMFSWLPYFWFKYYLQPFYMVQHSMIIGKILCLNSGSQFSI